MRGKSDSICSLAVILYEPPDHLEAEAGRQARLPHLSCLQCHNLHKASCVLTAGFAEVPVEDVSKAYAKQVEGVCQLPLHRSVTVYLQSGTDITHTILGQEKTLRKNKQTLV